MYKQISYFLFILLFGVTPAMASLSDIVVAAENDRLLAPEFTSEKLEGGEATLSDYKGKLILLNFWATWCIPCRAEMPGMEQLWKSYKDKGLVVVAISNDEGSRSRVEKFIEILDLSFPVLLDPEGQVSDLYKVSNMPTSILIDANGKIISYIVGTEEWSSDEAIQLVENLLPQ